MVSLPLPKLQIPISSLSGFYSIALWLMLLMHWHLPLQFTLLNEKQQRLGKEIQHIDHRQEHYLCRIEQLDNFFISGFSRTHA